MRKRFIVTTCLSILVFCAGFSFAPFSTAKPVFACADDLHQVGFVMANLDSFQTEGCCACDLWDNKSTTPSTLGVSYCIEIDTANFKVYCVELDSGEWDLDLCCDEENCDPASTLICNISSDPAIACVGTFNEANGAGECEDDLADCASGVADCP